MKDSKGKLHFIGIGGTAMVAGARLAIESGWEVRGSDNPLYPPTSLMVQELGVKVFEGYSASNLDWNPDVVIVGNALSRGNDEVEEVLKRRIPYTSLPEWLKNALLWERKPVVVCGTHGKTTTTTITSYLLDKCGLEPGYLIGGQPLDFEYSSRSGNSGTPFVIEGDEYDTAFFDKRAKFFHYLPEIAIVTSIEFDHGDIYRDIEEIEKTFQLMLRQIASNGWLIACQDDPRVRNLMKHSFSRVQSYGFDPESHWRGEMTGVSGGYTGLIVYRGGKRFADFAVPLAGRHNMQNTLAAIASATILGASPTKIRDALMEFKGVKRRMEVFLEKNGMIFVDDFAHHPTAIEATIKAAKERWPDCRLRVLVEPRSNTMVRNVHQDIMASSFENADEVYYGPIYRSDSIPEEERINREAIINELNNSNVVASVEDDVNTLVDHIVSSGKKRDVVLVLSNGAFDGIYQKFRDAF